MEANHWLHKITQWPLLLSVLACCNIEGSLLTGLFNFFMLFWLFCLISGYIKGICEQPTLVSNNHRNVVAAAAADDDILAIVALAWAVDKDLASINPLYSSLI